ncbi:unnamed protein product, partial [Adineta steineri]
EENNTTKPAIDQTNGYDQSNNNPSPTNIIKSSIPHLLIHQSNIKLINKTYSNKHICIYRFKSPLIQSLLNKARNTRSTDNLIQTSMTESMIDESITAVKSSIPTNLSDDDHQENSRLNNTTNDHSDLQ